MLSPLPPRSVTVCCCCSWWLLLLCSVILSSYSSHSTTTAMFMEDAGQLDFLVATSGHGTTRFAHRVKSSSVLVTSDSPARSDQLDVVVTDSSSTATTTTLSSTSCQVAGRDLATGRLLWRRVVCASQTSSGDATATRQHVVTASGDRFYTMDHNGIVRGWVATKGALMWDANIVLSALASSTSTTSSSLSSSSSSPPRLWLMKDVLVAVLGPVLSVLDTRSGRVLGSLQLDEVIAATTTAHGHWKSPSSEATSHWIQVVAGSADSSNSNISGAYSHFQVVLGWLEPQQGGQHWVGRASNAAVLEIKVTPEDGFIAPNAATPLPSSTSSSSYVASSWHTGGSTAGAVSLNKDKMSWIPLLSTNPQQQEKSSHRPLDLSNVLKESRWTSLDRWQSLEPHSNLVRLTGSRSDGVRTMAFLTWEEDSAQENGPPSSRQLVSASDTTDETLLALTHCAAFDNLVVGIQQQQSQDEPSVLWRTWQVAPSAGGDASRFEMNSIPIMGDVAASSNNTGPVLWGDDTVQDLITIACSANAMSVLLSTSRGSTRVVTFTKTGKVVKSRVRWTAEEGLATISSAVMLDASHIILEDDDNEETKKEPPLLVTNLDLASRLEYQYKSLTSMLLTPPLTIFGSNQNARRRSREQTFGFVKIAVLLSSKAHRVWGMGTTDPHRGELVWTLPLSQHATRHTLVHGKASAPVGINGISGGTHSREVLVLSDLENSIQWHCLDGTTGNIHHQGAVTISSPVLQIVPLLGAPTSASGKAPPCRQVALLLHQDRSITLVPQDDDGLLHAMAVHEVEASAKHGLHTHVVDQNHGKVESYRIHVNDQGAFEALLIGQTLFPGESVVGTSYPIRDEIVQSPAMILGDDSLLLKYLNPHMAVVVTFVANDNSTTSPPLLLPNKSTKAKRKPLGVTPTIKGAQPDDTAAATASDQEAPNLFVNIVDTVSGRVLHRTSHTNAARPLQPNIPMVINENWIIYSFVNEKIRRTELGVLSLYEGMIDRTGITAFSSPEQNLVFSSLDARESKPVVLAKSFAITKQVTALGVTVTRAGISTPQVLIACGDDKIYALDRRLLEPRRPVGELKETEKQEGLQQYRELLPLLALQAVTYNQTVAGVTSIISASTELESQSLVLAYGGPDIFFARTSPSRGFDLLPDSFNRILLSLVVLALLIALLVVRSMADKKIVKESWI